MGEEETGERWDKGKNLQSLFYSIKALQYTNNKSNKNGKTSDQKISNQ